VSHKVISEKAAGIESGNGDLISALAKNFGKLDQLPFRTARLK